MVQTLAQVEAKELEDTGNDQRIEGESKTEAFARIGRPRYRKAVKAIQLMGNLSNTYTYEYTDEQVKAIFDGLRKELDDAEARFTSQDPEEYDPFA